MVDEGSVKQLVGVHLLPAEQQIELFVLPHKALVICIFWDAGQLRVADWPSQAILTLLIYKCIAFV